MKLPQTLNTRLVLSHLLVSVVSIVLMAAFAGRSIYSAAIAEAEHSLQGLAFAAGNALELPIQEFRAGRVEASFIENLLVQMFADSPEITFTVYLPDGTPIADSRETLPVNALSVHPLVNPRTSCSGSPCRTSISLFSLPMRKLLPAPASLDHARVIVKRCGWSSLSFAGILPPGARYHNRFSCPGISAMMQAWAIAWQTGNRGNAASRRNWSAYCR